MHARRLSLCLFLVLGLGPGLARATPSVQLDAARVTLGDVLPTAPRELLALDIGPAPAPGDTSTLTRAAVAAALTRQGADAALADALPAQQKLTRRAQKLTSAHLERHIKASVRTKLPLGVTIERIVGLREQHVAIGELEVRVRLSRLRASTLATVTVLVGGRVQTRFGVTLMLAGQPRLPTLRRNLPRGSTIAAADVDLVEGEFSELPPRSVLQPVELVGKRLTQPGFSGKPVQKAAVEQPPVIERGAHVKVIAIAPGLRITQLGTAQEPGAMGELIRIRTATTTLKARVDGPGQATLDLGGRR